MDIITPSVKIKGTSDPAGAIIAALCSFGTDEFPRIPTEAEKWDALRRVRFELLALCDWTQVTDAPLTAEQRTAWHDYRQALRDIPQDFDTPESVIFPEAPNG
jgi:hypothetical protein